mmetsp:Transcript_6587/g.16706  ORF Transcript_6587/g.16706 Transcript_6587/m.16706 type:complete len:192 (-) Transcript_6587:203-778(-)
MFSLISGFWKIFFAKVEVQVLILGLDHAGKTTLLEQMKGLFNKQQGIPPERIPPTIGLNIGKMDVGTCRVIFWDLGGQVRMRSIWEKYYAEAHGMVFVIDSADVGRMEEAKLAFDAVREHEELRGIPVLLLANKQDLPVRAKLPRCQCQCQCQMPLPMPMSTSQSCHRCRTAAELTESGRRAAHLTTPPRR